MEALDGLFQNTFCQSRERPKRDFYRNAETRRNRNLTTETEIAETETRPKLLFHVLEILALKRRFTFA